MTTQTTERATVFQKPFLGLESTAGSATACLTRLTKLGFDLEPMINFTRLIANGYRVPVDQVAGRKWTNLKGLPSNPCYDELAYVLDWLLETSTPATPGGGTNSRTRNWNPPSSYENPVSYFTAKQGDKRTRASSSAGVFLTDMTMTWDQDKIDLTVNGLGRKFNEGIQLDTNEAQTITKASSPSSGSFTATLTDPNTLTTYVVTIPYDSTAAAIQTLVDTAIGAGNSLVTLGPLPNTAIRIEFRGAWGGANVATITIDNTLVVGGTFVVATATPGVAPTETQGIVIRPEHIKCYLDSTSGGLGTTKFSRLFAGSMNIKTVRGGVFVVDRDNPGGMVSAVPLMIDGKINVTIESDSQWAGVYANADGTNPIQFFRWEAVGTIIEGILAYTQRFDCAVKISKVNPNKDAGGAAAGVYCTDIEFDITHDPTWGKFLSAFNQNALSAVA